MSHPSPPSPAPAAAVRDARARAIVLRAAGTNCDAETQHALEAVGASAERLHLNALAAAPAALDRAELLVIPGGFSYGDHVAAGRLFGARLRRRLFEPLERFVERGGFVVGICNGFQVLAELGLLDGSAHDPASRGIALTNNRSGRFECRWVRLRNEGGACDWLEAGAVWPAPVANGEGRLAVRDDAVLERLRAGGQVALRYVSPDGTPPGYPADPSGSTDAIAGLCDPTGRVLGLMPHPERNVAPWHRPDWTRLPERAEGEGLAFFRGLVAAAARRDG